LFKFVILNKSTDYDIFINLNQNCIVLYYESYSVKFRAMKSVGFFNVAAK